MNSFIKKFLLNSFLLLILALNLQANDQPIDVTLTSNDVEVDITNVIVKGIETDIKLNFKDREFRQKYEGYPITINLNGQK